MELEVEVSAAPQKSLDRAISLFIMILRRRLTPCRSTKKEVDLKDSKAPRACLSLIMLNSRLLVPDPFYYTFHFSTVAILL